MKLRGRNLRGWICAMALALAAGIFVMPAKGAMASDLQKIYYGDIDRNGSVTSEDALLVLKHVVKLDTLQEPEKVVLADLNKDGKITSEDALQILKTVVKLVAPMPYETPAVSETPEPTLSPEPVVYRVPDWFANLSDENVGFPGADGFGKNATGGRGGKVYEVTNLNDSGPGSLREAVEASGPRIVIFKVSGTIYLKSRLTVKNGDITIAGQTAPGDGICLANFGLVVSRANNVILRYIRVRPGDQGALFGNEEDAIWVQASKDVIVDHCSTSWAVDETLSVSPSGDGVTYDDVSDRVSVQWCMVTESIRVSRLVGTRHGMGSLIRGAQGSSVTYHHNFYASHSSRMPMTGNYMPNEKDNGNFNFEFVNNVVYNWSGKKSGTCADADPNGVEIHTTNINYINNVFKKGPLSNDTYVFAEACIGNKMYISGNMVEGEVREDQRELVCFENDVLETKDNPYFLKSGLVIDKNAYFLSAPFEHSRMTGIQSAAEAEKAVLESVGTSLSRDSVDRAMIDAYKSGKEGKLIDAPSESLGWDNEKEPFDLYGEEYFNWMQGRYPKLASYEGYTDTDHDGMSDHWEEFMGLNPEDPADSAAQYKDSAYTNLDVFLQFLVENSRAAVKGY